MWTKTDIAKLPTPKPIRLWNWISIMLLVFVCVLFFMLFVTSVSVSNNTLFIVILSGITLFVTGLLFSVRIFLYGLEEEKVKIWDEQIKNRNKQWQEWSMQSLAVLGSVFITPQDLSVDDLLKNQGQLHFSAHELFSFRKTNHRFYLESYEWIFANFYDYLNQIGNNYTLKVLLLGSPEYHIEQTKLIRQAYKQLGGSLPLEFDYQSIFGSQQDDINQLIDNEEPMLYLIIADNAQSTDSSAFMSALLLANESLYTNIPNLRAQSYVLRSMQTNRDEFPMAIAQMHEIQPAFSHIEQLWYSQFDEKAVADLRILFFEYDIILSEMEYPAIYPLDTYFGHPSKALSYWLLLALTTQAVTKTQQTQLVVASILDNLWFTVVSPPIDDNVTE
ncbi:YrzE family protein [Gilliamella sp. wkB171]|uniref:YrzE family protein n=1 Tax=Gilliamella sp. wkB171 TaxID=3120258 RepID=UPI000812EE23|nr:YrzE family protein [Gilliamella apicola]OCL19166.1 hypothetical protein A9G03_09380 [Gilliamella apicola]